MPENAHAHKELFYHGRLLFLRTFVGLFLQGLARLRWGFHTCFTTESILAKSSQIFTKFSGYLFTVKKFFWPKKNFDLKETKQVWKPHRRRASPRKKGWQMFIKTIHGHDRITLCVHAHFQAHRVILSWPCVVVTKKSRNLVAKFGTKKVSLSYLQGGNKRR